MLSDPNEKSAVYYFDYLPWVFFFHKIKQAVDGFL